MGHDYLIIDICSTIFGIWLCPENQGCIPLGFFITSLHVETDPRRFFLTTETINSTSGSWMNTKTDMLLSLPIYIGTQPFHLLIDVVETPPSKLMQNLQFRYTRNFISNTGREATSSRADSKALLLRMMPILCSYPAYAYGRAQPSWLNTDFLL